MRLLILLLATGLSAADLTVSKAWSRASTPRQETGAVFALITGGNAEDRLLSVDSAAADVVELHEHASGPDGVMAMRAVPGGLVIAAGVVVELKPRSYHVMLIGLKRPLAKAQLVSVTFVFQHAGRITVQAEILDPWAMAFDDRY